MLHCVVKEAGEGWGVWGGGGGGGGGGGVRRGECKQE